MRKIRGSGLFDALGERIFDHPQLLTLLKKKVPFWLARDTSLFTLALAGYIFYIAEDYQKAESFFLKALQKDRRNLDHWLDLAFSLYHQGLSKQALAREIFFHHDELAKCSGKTVNSLKEIQRRLSCFPLQADKI